LAGDSLGGGNEQTRIYYIGGRAAEGDTLVHNSLVLDGYYNYGPVLVDIDNDGQPEIVACSPDGELVYVTVDTTNTDPSFSILAQNGEPGGGRC